MANRLGRAFMADHVFGHLGFCCRFSETSPRLGHTQMMQLVRHAYLFPSWKVLQFTGQYWYGANSGVSANVAAA